MIFIILKDFFIFLKDFFIFFYSRKKIIQIADEQTN